jgi:uncharacterized membrane protein YfhO
MLNYLELLTDILTATMSKGQYHTALQALQTMIRFSHVNNKNQFTRLEELDDETLKGLIANYNQSQS